MGAIQKTKIIETHIENDLRNGTPTLVYTDEHGVEWVHEEQSSNHGGYITVLVRKRDSWYWRKD